MYMVIRSYFIDRAGERVGEPCSTVSYPNCGGWADFETFAANRLRHFKDHPREAAEREGNRLRIQERTGNYGLRLVHDITFERV